MKKLMKHNIIWASGLMVVIALFSFSLRPVVAQDELIAVETDPLHPIEIFQGSPQALTIAEAFSQAGVEYYPEDIVTVFPDPSLGLGSIITVQRSMPINLTDGKKSYIVRTWENTVKDILSEKKITLGDDDRISPTLATPLQMNMKIAITRVARTTITEIEKIIYKVIENDDSTLYRGNNIVTQEGQNGSREKKYLLIREDGELISKTLTSNTVTKNVVNKIIRIGTKLKIGFTIIGPSTYYGGPTRVAIAIRLLGNFNKGDEVRITNLANGRSIIVRIDDVCACNIDSHAAIDLRKDLYAQLDPTLHGVIRVRIEKILP